MDNEYSKFWMKAIASRIEHTFLKHEASKKEITRICDEAIEHGFFSVCLFPNQVKFAKKYLKKTNVAVTTVVGFPLGENTLRTKIFEAKEAMYDGADEIDMVMSISAALAGDFREIERETTAVKRAIRDLKLKVILETCLLTDDQIIKAAAACMRGRADFVKTSTGFSTAGAETQKVELLAATVKNSKTQIKAAGGIKTLDELVSMVNAGATRIGTSHGVAIMATPVTREYILENDLEKGLVVANSNLPQ